MVKGLVGVYIGVEEAMAARQPANMGFCGSVGEGSPFLSRPVAVLNSGYGKWITTVHKQVLRPGDHYITCL
jgi:hypothetical protein